MHDAARMAVRNRKRTSVAVPILVRKGELALATRQGRADLITPSVALVPARGAPCFADYAPGTPFDCLRLSEMDFIAVIDMRLRLA